MTKKRPSKKRLPQWFVSLAVVSIVLGGATWYGLRWWAWATAPAVSAAIGATQAQSVTLEIPPGTSAQHIGQTLEAKGLIRSATAWNLWTRWLGMKEPQGGFQAGTYQLSVSQSLPEIATQIWLGDVKQMSFTIPEGWSIQDMATYFEQQRYFSAQEFLAAVDQFNPQAYPWLPTNLPADARHRLEGFLYPDTYLIAAGQPPTPEAVIRQMLDRFQQVALPLYEPARGSTQLSLAQWVTLASIVEKEAVVANERRLIAGVFHNRLRQGMPLGSDPTVEYAFGIKQTPDRPLTFAQVEMPSPYNTYITPGLPPTAIASPGVASLEATLQPEATEYLYFVARYDGTHVFSRTEAEHLAAQDAIHDRREASQPDPSGQKNQ